MDIIAVKRLNVIERMIYSTYPISNRRFIARFDISYV